MKILLMGNPNVGKSVIFSRLTGINVIASNYPGTTITYTATPVIFLREIGVPDTLKSTTVMIFSALIAGGLLNLLL